MLEAKNFKPVLLVSVTLQDDIHLTIPSSICEINWVPLGRLGYVCIGLLERQFPKN